ncbi:MAG: hypothetical protein VKJ46_09180, partial [Leptolyngbyaceae bacterium]|nr:hypothetical protein [Leptolyngbyaceae bacterium]
MIQRQQIKKTPFRRGRRNLWFERSMALIASANLGLVFFDLSYIPWRNFYLHEVPALTRLYDPVKAIEPHRDTQRYLATVDQLEEQVAATGLQSPTAARLLRRLRLLSRRMIEEDPFQIANKSGTLAKIKNLMREQIGTESSQEAFATFWSVDYLSQNGWSRQTQFFNDQIRPLIETNYYRPIGENNDFVDYFWLIDLPFVLLFALEFLARTYYISRRHVGVSWLDAMLWRWYDLFLLIPFWRWLRVIPVTIRLNQADLINLERVRVQVSQGVAAHFAEELSEVIVIRVLNQLQDTVQRGDIVDRLFHAAPTDINQINELEELAALVVKALVYEVLPQIQPDLEALLRHQVESALCALPIYQGLQQVTGLNQLPTQMIDKLVAETTQAAYQGLTAA